MPSRSSPFRVTWLESDRPLARAVGRPLAAFLDIEAASGVFLLAATATAQNRTIQDGKLTIRYCKTLMPVGGIANPLSFSHLGFLKNFDVIHCLQFPTLVTEMAILSGAFHGRKAFVTDLAGGTYYCLSRVFPVERYVREFLLISEFNRGLNHRVQRPSRVIYGGVNTDFFSPDSVKADEPRFLYVGRIFDGKGIHDLIDALPEGAVLDIAGQCHDSGYLQELRKKSEGKKVFFHDSPSDLEILDKYRKARALVLPSLVDGGFTSAMEAMACGLAVVGTRVGSLPEVVKDGVSGFLVSPGRVDELRNRLLFCLEHPEEMKEMGRKGRERALENFTWRKTALRCLEAYRS